MRSSLSVPAEYQRQRTRGESVCSDLSLSSSTSSLHGYLRLPLATQWGHEHVRQWLTANQLTHILDRSVCPLPLPLGATSTLHYVPKQRSCLIQADSTFRQIQTRFNICSSFVKGFTAAFMEKMIVELSHKYS